MARHKCLGHPHARRWTLTCTGSDWRELVLTLSWIESPSLCQEGHVEAMIFRCGRAFQ